MDSMVFSNCFNLDRDVVDTLLANAQLTIQCMAEVWAKEWRGDYFDTVIACDEISKKLDYRSMDSSITVKLYPDPERQSEKFLGFAPCVVVDFGDNHENIDMLIVCKFKLKTEYIGYHDFESRWALPLFDDQPTRLESNHTIIWFDEQLFLKDKHYEEASFEFYIIALDDQRHIDHIKVKKCGVHVFYVDAEASNGSEVESSKNFSSDEEGEEPADHERLTTSCEISPYQPRSDEEDICNPNSWIKPNSPVDPNFGGLMIEEEDGSIVEKEHGNPITIISSKPSGSFISSDIKDFFYRFFASCLCLD